MRYVSKIISYDFSEVYWSDFIDIMSIEITDDATGRKEEFNCQGWNKRNFTFMNDTYGVELEWGVFLVRDIDLKLYELIEYTMTIKNDYKIMFNLEKPIDEFETLYPNSNRFSGSNPYFSLGQVVLSKYDYSPKWASPVQVHGDILDIIFKPAGVIMRYKILDLVKFNRLITKYKTLSGGV